MTAISAVVIALTACGGNSENNSSKTASGSAVSSSVAAGATGAAIEFNPSEYVEKLGEYKGLEYTETKTDVTDEEIEQQVKSFLAAYPAKVTDRDVKKGDTVNIDYLGKKDGVAFDGGTASGASLTIGSGKFIPGFEDGLIGKKPGETVDLNLTFPKEYNNNPDLAGAKVVFTVTVNYIVGEAPTELTDEIVKENTEFSTAADYRDSIKKKLTEQKIDAAKATAQTELLEKVVTSSSIKSVPKAVEDRYYSQFTGYYKNMAAAYGMELKDLITNQFKITEEDFETKAKEYANIMGKQLVVVRAIAEAENIKVSDEEYKAGLEKYYENSGAKGQIDLEAYEAEVGKGNISDIILTDKVVTFLMDNGKAVAPKADAEESTSESTSSGSTK